MSNLLWSLMAKLLWSLSPRRSQAAVSVVVAAGLVFFAPAAPSSAAPSPETALRAATAKYHSITRALADGFVPTDECAELPAVGVMGYHYVNPERLGDGVIDANNPDILLYTKGEHGRLRLAGAEWFAVDPDQDLSTDDGRPELFGQKFDGPMPGHEPGMPIHFDLHAWVWQDNPAGTFAPWNPALTCS